jgi:magnesium-transporting ATPase (P-type)
MGTNHFTILTFSVLRNGGRKVDIPSSALRVGDIIEVKANQRIPADLILLYTS